MLKYVSYISRWHTQRLSWLTEESLLPQLPQLHGVSFLPTELLGYFKVQVTGSSESLHACEFPEEFPENYYSIM